MYRLHSRLRQVSGIRACETELAGLGRKNFGLIVTAEEGVVEIDAHIKDRIDALKTERELTQAALDRIAGHARSQAQITPDRIAAFSCLMSEKLAAGDTQARKAYLQSVIDRIEVDNRQVPSSGTKTRLPPPWRAEGRPRVVFVLLYVNGARFIHKIWGAANPDGPSVICVSESRQG